MSFEEKIYVENNRFTKIELSDSYSDDDQDNSKDQIYKPEKDISEMEKHEHSAADLFRKKRKWSPSIRKQSTLISSRLQSTNKIHDFEF